ncbi:AAA family ATPase [Mucilaginibacter xinganensis]|uniref:Resolvase HTH domain-containing protein n=1 Tax=Mucilaginibacter xinganensis TaxID=1234841 RepID=A0A223P1M0_9SPHI|nr:AAA family ATPase [Mucilaginibacter xinganensis]ASU35834.1 hypothetical protein MuYL_3949 [Mucilaginibacter xinganensis]
MKQQNKEPLYIPFVRPAAIESIRDAARPPLPAGMDPDLLPGDELPLPEPEPHDFPAEEEDEEEDTAAGNSYRYDNNGAFIIRTGEDWLLDHTPIPEPTMLFGKFWHRDELCILFADTNVGKSVLAVQIADSISRGRPIAPLQMDAPAVPVLYFDFELSDAQFQHRYSTPADGKYPFTKNFCRAQLNPCSAKQNKFSSYEEFINNEIENALLAYQAKVLIIDNITCLRYGTQSAAGAQNLMQYLQNIKRKYNVSILVLAHTPKRNTAKPLSRNDLQGSKMLINFADSAFAIGESQQSPGLRYLKQIKQRSSSETHGAENICLGQIVKESNFLHFRFGGHGHETDHLTPYTELYRKNTQNRIGQLKKQGQTIRQIAARLGLATTTVFRTLKRLERCEEGEEFADVQTKNEETDERERNVMVSLSNHDMRIGPDDAPTERSKSAGNVMLTPPNHDVRKSPEAAEMRTINNVPPVILNDSEGSSPHASLVILNDSEGSSPHASLVILNDSEGSSPREPADKSAPNNPLTHPTQQTDEHERNFTLTPPNHDVHKGHDERERNVMVSLPNHDVRKGPNERERNVMVSLSNHDGRKGPDVVFTEQNNHPPLPGTPMHVTGKNFALYKQYQKEMAMLKADERANERRGKYAGEAEGTQRSSKVSLKF